LGRQNKESAIKAIHSWAKLHIPSDAQDRFIEMVETQLLGMHEGNIANYGIKPQAFLDWQKSWR